MHFEHFNDIETRYAGTFILVDGEPYHVDYIEDDGEVYFKVSNENGERRKLYPFGNDVEIIELDYSADFYISSGRELLFVRKTSRRQWRQGFTSRQYRAYHLNSGGVNSLAHYDTWGAAKAWAGKNIRSVEEVTERVRQDYPTVLSRSMAVDKDGIVFYMDKDIGTWQDGKVVVYQTHEWIQSLLAHLKLEHSVSTLSKSDLTATVTVPDLLKSGVSEEEIKALLGIVNNGREQTAQSSLFVQQPVPQTPPAPSPFLAQAQEARESLFRALDGWSTMNTADAVTVTDTGGLEW